MTDVVIHAENLGKKYTIGHQAENGRYVALRTQGRALRDPARGVYAKLWYHSNDDRYRVIRFIWVRA
jgi:hypothetical protein